MLIDIIEKMRYVREVFLSKGPLYLDGAADGLQSIADLFRKTADFIRDLKDPEKVQALSLPAEQIEAAERELELERNTLIAVIEADTAEAMAAAQAEVAVESNPWSLPIDWRRSIIVLLINLLEELLGQLKPAPAK